MNTSPLESRLEQSLRGARRRVAAILLLAAALPLAGLLLLASRWSMTAAIVIAAIGTAVVGALLWRRLRSCDRAWLARRLNALRADLEDSAELIWSAGTIPPLQALQRARILERLAGRDLPEVRPVLPRKLLGCCALAGVVLTALALWQPWQGLSLPQGSSPDAAKTPAGIEARLAITPPAYTGAGESVEHSLEARVPENSRVEWSLRFAQQQPSAAALVFHDGSRLALARKGERWIASKTLAASTLYRIETQGQAADERLYRLDAIADRAPEITVRAPDKTLSVLDAAQPKWDLSFEARDDYGLGDAELSIALAQGSGETIKVTQQTQILKGEGNARERRYRQALDLTRLGFAQGDDLIVRLSVADNRQPEPNRARSASFILRWPPEASSESAGIEGLVRQTLPAYFRSQRQIVMDTEALIAERGDLSAPAFEKRSDAIGVDQKLMRLRYGQFLGEESEAGGEPHHEDPHAAQRKPETADQPGTAEQPQHEDEPNAAKPGSDRDILHEFGHAHDIKEAATLLDDATKALLRSALNEMWDAEGQLRVGQPDAALPHEYRALEAIKQVQQSTRIYLARVGQDLPPVDMTRRLTGERAGLSDPPPPAAAAAAPVGAPQAAWQALERGQAPDVDALQAWVSEHASEAPDSLALIREAERLRRDPACAECRAALSAQLWPLLPPPGTALQPRGLPDVQGASYLQALPAEPAR